MNVYTVSNRNLSNFRFCSLNMNSVSSDDIQQGDSSLVITIAISMCQAVFLPLNIQKAYPNPHTKAGKHAGVLPPTFCKSQTTFLYLPQKAKLLPHMLVGGR